jgi:hypothetical protein
VVNSRGVTVAYYPGGVISLSGVYSSPTAQIWQYLHSPFEEKGVKLPKIHPAAMAWIEANAAPVQKIQIEATRIPALPSLYLPGSPRPFYAGARYTKDFVPKFNIEKYWFALHGREVGSYEFAGLDGFAVLSAFRKKWFSVYQKALATKLAEGVYRQLVFSVRTA